MQSGFWLLLFADSISALGSRAGWLACAWSVVARSEPGSAFWVAALAIGFGVSNAIASPVAGSLLDRLPKRPAIVGANAALAAIWVGIAVCVGLHSAIWMWFLLLTIAGLLSPLTDLGWIVLLPALVEDDALDRANGISELAFQGAMLAGPVVGGALANTVGTPIALLTDAASFCVAGFVMFRLPMPTVQSTDTRMLGFTSVVSNLLLDMKTGIRFLLQQRLVLLVTILAFVLNFEAGLEDVAFPLAVHSEFHATAFALAVLLGLYALGMGVGALGYGFLKVTWTRGQMPLWVVLIWACLLVAFLFAHHLVPICILTGLAGVVFGMYPPMARSAVQRLVSPELRGSVFGFRMTLFSIAVPLGSFAAGFLSLTLHLIPTDLVGWTATVIAVGVSVLIGVRVWLEKRELLQ